jgi:hypothetical protein
MKRWRSAGQGAIFFYYQPLAEGKKVLKKMEGGDRTGKEV